MLYRIEYIYIFGADKTDRRNFSHKSVLEETRLCVYQGLPLHLSLPQHS